MNIHLNNYYWNDGQNDTSAEIIPSNGDNVPFSCYENKKLKDFYWSFFTAFVQITTSVQNTHFHLYHFIRPILFPTNKCSDNLVHAIKGTCNCTGDSHCYNYSLKPESSVYFRTNGMNRNTPSNTKEKKLTEIQY